MVPFTARLLRFQMVQNMETVLFLVNQLLKVVLVSNLNRTDFLLFSGFRISLCSVFRSNYTHTHHGPCISACVCLFYQPWFVPVRCSLVELERSSIRNISRRETMWVETINLKEFICDLWVSSKRRVQNERHMDSLSA